MWLYSRMQPAVYTDAHAADLDRLHRRGSPAGDANLLSVLRFLPGRLAGDVQGHVSDAAPAINIASTTSSPPGVSETRSIVTVRRRVGSVLPLRRCLDKCTMTV